MTGILLKPVFALRNLISDHGWTKTSTLAGIAWLVIYRTQMYYNNCYHMGDHDGPIERNGATVYCDEFSQKFRHIDGVCNDLSKPLMGSVDGFVGRNTDPVQFDGTGKDYDILDPNPRKVSLSLFTKEEHIEAGFLNAMAAAWINFFVHDLVDHGMPKNGPGNIYVPIEKDDPVYDTYAGGDQCMVIPETPNEPQDKVGNPHRNRGTHWWDASHIYGSHKWRNEKLRSYKDGKMHWDTTNNHLPLTADKRGFVTGDRVGNVWIGVAMLHNAFVNEHNLVCDMLKKAYPSWDDEKLFHTARMVNTAVVARVHTVEWTPGALPQESISMGMHANWNGLLNRDHTKGGLHVTAATHGIFGSKTNHYGVDFAITEEFTSIYRLHSFVPETIPLRTPTDGKRVVDSWGTPIDLDVMDTTSNTYESVKAYGLPTILYSFLTTPPGLLTIKNHPAKMSNMVLEHLHPAQENPSKCKNVGVLDLQVVDLIRDRERGTPRYNDFRSQIHLPPAKKFSDITANVDIQKRLEDVYDGDINKIDLLTGTLAEDKFPGFGFSPTIFHLFVLMASRRIQSDRFYTKDFTPEVYTQEGLEWISTRGFQDIMSEFVGKNPINPDGTDSKDFWSTANPFYLHGSVPGRPASHCLDGVANFGEFGIDCGGACPRCGIVTFFGVIIKMALKFSIVLAPILVVLLLGRSSKGKAKTA